MKRNLLMMCFLIAITTSGYSQQWQTMLSLDSRVGYSTNSYLNPFLSEWDPAVESAYNFTSIIGQTFWYNNGHSFSLMGGPLYMPLFNEQLDSWKGGVGLLDYNYSLSDKVSIGFEGGISYVTGGYSRTLIWAQPKLTWFISPFTLLRTKVGSNFRTYRNYGGAEQTKDRLDLYSLEFETWPGYQWRLRAGLHGKLNTLPNIGEGFNSRASVSYYLRNGASVTLSGDLAQYQYEETTEEEGGSGPVPPVGGGPSTTTSTHTNRTLSFGVEGTYPINSQFTLFAGAKGLQLSPESSSTPVNEFRVSGGVRFSFNPKFGTKKYAVNPEWTKDRGEQEVRIRYSGEGQLYLVGSFNDWNKQGIPLTRQAKNSYTTQLSLEAGAYEYKVLKIQGGSEEWLPFSNEVYTVDDGFGSKNAMLLVE